VHVRRARLADRVEIAEVWLRSRKASAPGIPPPVHGDDDVRAWVAQLVGSKEVWVAQVGDRVVAMLVLDHDWLDQLYVDPAWTGSGAGSLLVGVAKMRRPRGLELWTFRANTGARRFYERHGFVAVGPERSDNEEGAPAVHYEWFGSHRLLPPRVDGPAAEQP
jgi:GNAT superfamily N-acetyltransferase